MDRSSTRKQGFTIVELLIVVIVISILAAIAIIGFAGVRQRTADSVLQTELKSAATQLGVANINNGQYPSDESGLKLNQDVTYQYTYHSNDNSYCLSGTSNVDGVSSYHVSSVSPTVTTGLCAEHSAATGTPSTEIAKILASDPSADSTYGKSVSISGNTAIIGSPQDAGGVGSVYIFTMNGSVWSQQAKLTAGDAVAGDQFGHSVAISGDTVVIGAPYHNAPNTGNGAVYVFTRSGSAWSQQAKLIGSQTSAFEQLGFSVAIDTDTILAGSLYDDGAGSGYIFTRSGSTWTEQARLVASDAEVYDFFGHSVGISGDTAVIGAYQNDDAGSNSGSAYVFTRSGSTWTEGSKITASDANAYNWFGYSVAVSGGTVVVGSHGNDNTGADNDPGSAYVFTLVGSTWQEQAKLVASDVADYDNFGASVAIVGDTAVVGARGKSETGAFSGAAYVLTRSGSTWTQHAKISASDGAADDSFGSAVSVSGDKAIIGAPNHDDSFSNSGSAYIFGP